MSDTKINFFLPEENNEESESKLYVKKKTEGQIKMSASAKRMFAQHVL